ncbi:hypothetical protein [Amycolatopsis rifamycinica]|uniref:Uncharacterized protein n=1 Tax=Amycolatopsis rifamycinica TaxID=287986 RepID=A0A066TZ23_9PSEU|nr:hypothetical protein [Amycolatopsis rifamycinica]KDN18852.1 hypothetical protein DV20_28305 [Amycolatopsis rifamycinica]
MASETFTFATGEHIMSATFSANVRTLFGDLGIEVENTSAVETGLVIDRFEMWGDSSSNQVAPVRASFCRMDVLEAA